MCNVIGQFIDMFGNEIRLSRTENEEGKYLTNILSEKPTDRIFNIQRGQRKFHLTNLSV